MRCLHSILIFAATALLLAGCGGPQASLHYYELTAMASPASEANKLADLTLAVGPVTIPEMLKRQELVLHVDGPEYEISSLDRWAGLIEKDITAAIIENLGKQLGTQKVVGFPWGTYFDPEYRVLIDILSLTGKPGETVKLRAGWTIIDRSGKQILARNISEYQQTLTDPNMDSLVKAESQAIALLCQDISDALRQLAKH